ncbi:MAG: hypothetical protein Kow0077_28680 [Anaerolineae bacterium]
MGGLTGFTIQDLLALLQPNGLFDYLLYIILFIVLITLFMQGEGALTVTMLLAVVVVAIFIDKVQALPGHKCSVFTLIIRVTYFVIPLLVAGISKQPKSRPWAVIAAFLGLGYTFALWAVEMRNPSICAPLPRDVTMLLDTIRAFVV